MPFLPFLTALNFVNLVDFSLQKVQEFIKINVRGSKCVKIADCALLESLELILRKICVIEKS